MTDTHAEPIEAAAVDGIVGIWVDSKTARAIADAWDFTWTAGGLPKVQRPTYFLDSAGLRAAAAHAHAQAAADLSVRYVPLEQPTRPQLRVVGGER